MQYQIIHTTEYHYHHSVSLCHNIAKLVLRNTDAQHCKKVQVKIIPQPDVMNEYEDFFGNKVMYFAIQQEHKHLKVTVHSQVEKKPDASLKMNLYGNISWEETKKQLMQPGPENFDARQYIPVTDITTATEEIYNYTLQSFTPNRPIFEASYDLTKRIYKDFQFKPGFTTIATPLAEVMKEFNDYVQNGPTLEEVKFMQSAIGQGNALSYETPGQKAAFIRRILEYNLSPDFVAQQNKILKSMTVAQMKANAARFLKPEQINILLVGDKAKILDSVKKLGYEVVELDTDGNKVDVKKAF